MSPKIIPHAKAAVYEDGEAGGAEEEVVIFTTQYVVSVFTCCATRDKL